MISILSHNGVMTRILMDELKRLVVLAPQKIEIWPVRVFLLPRLTPPKLDTSEDIHEPGFT